MDEKTNLQPRTRKAKTLPPVPNQPIRVENEYQRKGALHLFAALDTSGKVYHTTRGANARSSLSPCWKN